MNDNVKKVAIGATIAATAGYIAGVLTAPKSGRQTRKDIKSAAYRAKREAEKSLKKLCGELDELINQVKKGAKKLSKSAGEEFATAVTKAQFAKQKAREAISSIHEGDISQDDLNQALDEAEEAIVKLRQFVKKHPTAAAS